MAYCSNCGAELQKNTVFCGECGAKVEAEQTEDNFTYREADTAPQNAVENPPEKGSVRLCADGKYRWIYEFSMLKNPTIFFTVLKVFMLCGCAPALIVLFASLGSEGLSAFISCAKVYGVVMLVAVPLTLFAYFIVAAIYGWKYIVLFEMDDKGIVHIQQDKQFKKAQGIALLTMLTGRVGQGLLVSSKNSQSSLFRSVRTVKGMRRRNTIKVNELLAHNQIYVQKEDYDFVWNFITSRSENAKIK